MNLLDMIDEQGEIPGLVTPAAFLEAYQSASPEIVAFDSESPTWKWHLPEAAPFTLTFSWGLEDTYYVPCANDDPEAARALYTVLTSTPIVVAHHAKYDCHVAKRLLDAHNYPLALRQVNDTMILSHVLDENRYHGLKELCTDLGIAYGDGEADELKNQIKAWIEEQGKMEGREMGYDEVPLRLMVPYALGDAYLTLELFRYFLTDLEEQLEGAKTRNDLHEIYNLELDFLWVVFALEERGMRVDLDYVYDQVAKLTPQLEDDRTALSASLGWEINPLSTDELARALVQLGHEDALWTNPKTGKVNLPEWRLEALADEPTAGDLVKRVLNFRTNSKMLSSYYEVLLREHSIDEKGQAIVRCNVKQLGARTGRQSVTEPALQTIPREKGEVRGAFIAREGHTLIFSDYSQQELRVLAHYMEKLGDKSMADIFREGVIDLHKETAASMFQVPYDEVTKEQRYLGKETNFAIVYGAGIKKIAAMHGVDFETAKQRLNRLYKRFPGLMKLKRTCEVRMRSQGHVVTAFGRRHREKEGRFAYKAVNSLVQGTSADMTKAAMVRIDRALRDAGMSSMIVLSVHDEVIVEAPLAEAEQAQGIIKKAMLDVPEICVPMDVEVSVATRWSDA